MIPNMLLRPCPICRKPVLWETTPSRPFCSERCRMADLGRWFRGDYAIGRPIEEDDLSEDIRRAPPESGR